MDHYKVSAKDDKDKKIDFLRRFIKVFNRSKGSFYIYPTGHPMLDRAVQSLYSIITEYVKLSGRLTFEVVERNIKFENSTFSDEDPLFSEFAGLLFVSGIHYISCENGITREDIKSLFKKLVEESNHLEQVSYEDISHIKIKYIDYSELLWGADIAEQDKKFLAYKNKLNDSEVEELEKDIEDFVCNEDRTFIFKSNVYLLLELLKREAKKEDYALILEDVEDVLKDLLILGEYGLMEKLLLCLVEHSSSKDSNFMGRQELVRGVLRQISNSNLVSQLIFRVPIIDEKDLKTLASIFLTNISDVCKQSEAFVLTLKRPCFQILINAFFQAKTLEERERFIFLITQIGKPLIPELIMRLRDSSPLVVKDVLLVLRRVKEGSAAGEIEFLFDHPDPEIRAEAISLFMVLSPIKDYSLLFNALKDKNEMVRKVALEYIDSMEDGKILLQLLDAFRKKASSKFFDLQCVIIKRLGDIKYKQAAPEIIDVLNKRYMFLTKKVKNLITESAISLSKIDIPDAKEAIEKKAKSGRRGIRKICSDILGSFYGR